MNKVDTKSWAARSFVGALLLLLLAAPADLLAQERTMTITDAERLGLEVATDIAPAVQALPTVSKTAALTFYGTRAAFDAAFPGAVDEDFDSSILGPAFICADLTPLDSSTSDACYAAGDIVEGFEFNTDGLLGPPIDYAYVGSGAFGNASDALGPNTFGDGAILDFPDGVSAVGFDVACPFNPGNMQIDIVGAGGLLGSTTIACGGAFPGTFVGVSSDAGSITSVEFVDVGSGAAAELLTNLSFTDSADLMLSKVCEADFETKTASFHIDVTNLGPGDAGGIVVQDWLPAATLITNWDQSQGAFNPFSGIWDVGSVAAGGSASLWIYVDLLAQGRYDNHAEITASGAGDPNPDNNSAECGFILLGDRVVPDFVPGAGAGGIANRGDRFSADLGVTKSVSTETAVTDDEVTFTVMVENFGPQSTAKVVVNDKLDACLVFVSASADKGTYDDVSGDWTVGSLKVGQKATLTIVATVTGDCSGVITNTAEVTSSSLPDPSDFFNLFDEPPSTANNTASAEFSANSANARELDGTRVALGHNYPNPFNPVTVVPFSLPEASAVSIQVYDLLGRTVATLVDGQMAAGVHEVRFEASHLPTGMYLVRMEAAGIVKTMRVTLMK